MGLVVGLRRSSRRAGTEKSQRGQAVGQHLPTALRANPMPNKSGPAPKAETDQKTPIIGTNGRIYACAAVHWL